MRDLLIDPLRSSEILLGLSLIVQSLEFLALRSAFSDGGTWRWRTLERDFRDLPRWLPALASTFLPYRPFMLLLLAQLLGATLILFMSHATLLLLLFTTVMLICIRWRGTFNGGSDYVTVLLVGALAVARILPDSSVVVALPVFYVGIQLTLSYFLAGVAKIRKRSWRSGEALRPFLASASFDNSAIVQYLLKHPAAARIITWGVITFECTFPAAILMPDLTLPYLVSAACFHLANAYFLGLNRFFFAWIATFPLLYSFCRAVQA